MPLLNRSTRRVGLTEDGAQYFRRAKPLVDEADALFRETRERASDVSGRLKLAVPPGIAEHLILPPTLDFIREHPHLDVILDVDPRQTDVIADGYDAAIRSGALVGPGLKSRRLADIHFRLCAAPVYIERHGVPEQVDNLAHHRIAHWYVPGGQAPWQFETADGPAEIAVTGPLATNSLHGQFKAVHSGLAMAALPNSLVQDCLDKGEFVEVLADAKIIPTPALDPLARAHFRSAETPSLHRSCRRQFEQAHMRTQRMASPPPPEVSWQQQRHRHQSWLHPNSGSVACVIVTRRIDAVSVLRQQRRCPTQRHRRPPR